jgi:membrane fusion protein (multidrug efflux system)
MRWLALSLCLVASPAWAQNWIFEGEVEPYRSALLSSDLNGRVEEVLFSGGETVQTGDPLILLDKARAELALRLAEASLAAAEASALLARQEAERAERLGERGVSSQARREASAAGLAVAQAELATALTLFDEAQLDLERATIRAPMSGTIGRPATAVGAFLEAEAGPSLAEIVQLDEVLVAYRVPYETRLEALESGGYPTLEALLERIALTIQAEGLSGQTWTGKPLAASARIDPRDGSVTVWAVVANPGLILRPGMKVSVLSEVITD